MCEANIEGVTIIDTRKDKSIHDTLGGGKVKETTDFSDPAELEEVSSVGSLDVGSQ